MDELRRKKLARVASRWLSVAPLLALFALLLPPVAALAQSDNQKEYQIKAAFLFHFTEFVTWPDLGTNNATPFRIGVLGDNTFANDVRIIVQGETMAGRPIEVVHAKKADELTDCQIVFVSKSLKVENPRILKEFAGKGILTVGECSGFTQNGGIVSFYLEGGKVRFEINVRAAEQEDLKLSSQLLKLGKIVEY